MIVSSPGSCPGLASNMQWTRPLFPLRYAGLFLLLSAGADYQGVGRVKAYFNSTTSIATIHIPIINDDTVEGNETFTVLLTTADLAVELSPAIAVATIIDDNDG